MPIDYTVSALQACCGRFYFMLPSCHALAYRLGQRGPQRWSGRHRCLDFLPSSCHTGSRPVPAGCGMKMPCSPSRCSPARCWMRFPGCPAHPAHLDAGHAVEPARPAGAWLLHPRRRPPPGAGGLWRYSSPAAFPGWLSHPQGYLVAVFSDAPLSPLPAAVEIDLLRGITRSALLGRFPGRGPPAEAIPRLAPPSGRRPGAIPGIQASLSWAGPGGRAHALRRHGGLRRVRAPGPQGLEIGL